MDVKSGGLGNVDFIEKDQFKFYKYIFKHKKLTLLYMVYGELGIFPVCIDLYQRIILDETY
jgi:hypothetical protein